MAGIVGLTELQHTNGNSLMTIATTGDGNVKTGTTTTSLRQSLCKAFSTVDTSSSNTVLSSLNIASITDVGTGVITSNFTSAFSNGDYYELAIADASLGDYSLGNTVDSYSTTTSARSYNVRRDNGSTIDEQKAGILIFGDLA